jgi:hypothetical protein
MEEKRQGTLEVQDSRHDVTSTHIEGPGDSQLIQYREGTEKNIRFLVGLVALNFVLTPLTAYYFSGWVGVIISMALNGIAFFVGRKAITRVQKIVWN